MTHQEEMLDAAQLRKELEFVIDLTIKTDPKFWKFNERDFERIRKLIRKTEYLFAPPT